MKTITIDSKVMREFGIDYLTGEACAISMRKLCEIDEPMMKTYLAYTGIKTSIVEIAKSDYNDREKYSCFLTHEVIEDLIIMRLMEDNEMVTEILPNPKNCDGFSVQKHLVAGTMDEVIDYCQTINGNPSSFYQVGRTYCINKEQPRRGLSNIHAWTGLSQ